MNSKQDIGTKIMHRRKELKISQEELADQTGVARQTVSAWERNFFIPKGKHLMALSRVLKVSVGFFVDEETNSTSNEEPASMQEIAANTSLSFALAPFASIYDYAQTRACNSTRENRAEAIHILKLTINELEKANALENR